MRVVQGGVMFAKNAPSMTWRCAVGAASLLLVLQLSSPARGEGTTVPAQTHSQRAPLPRPGTYRLIRIGPQALVKEDDRGRITMVDELDDKTAAELDHQRVNASADKADRGARAAAVMIGVLTAGAVLMLGLTDLNGNFDLRAGPR
jgi:hypothetical protein